MRVGSTGSIMPSSTDVPHDLLSERRSPGAPSLSSLRFQVFLGIRVGDHVIILQVVEIPSRQLEKVITDTRLSLSSFQSTIAFTNNNDGQPSATHTARLLNLPFLFHSFFFLFFF